MAFADAGVALDRTVVADGGRTFLVGDMLAASQRNFHERQELGWTLVALSTYLEPGATWSTRKSRQYRLEDLVALAVRRDPRNETEGGFHHLYGVAFALRNHTTRGGKIDGSWAEAVTYLDEYVQLTKAWQQKDGALSGGVFGRDVEPRDPSHLVSTTGHALEWLSLAMSPEELRAPWVGRAVARLCDVMDGHAVGDLSDGGLYHAVHALRLYRDVIE